jgi:hypothetical protein
MSDGLEPETGQNKRRRYTGKTEQAGHLWSWERSGLSGGEYARLHGLKARDLYRWRKLQANGAPERTGGQNGEIGSGGFMTIDVDRQSLGATPGMRVAVKRGPLEVEVSGGSAEELVRVAGRLKREVLDA